MLFKARASGTSSLWMWLRLVDVVQAGGATKRLEVAKGEVLRLNQRHQLSSRGKHILLEDGLKCVSAIAFCFKRHGEEM